MSERPARKSLASAFDVSARADGLAQLLPPREQTEPRPRDAEAANEQAPVAELDEPKPAQRPQAAGRKVNLERKARAVVPAATTIVNLAVYLPPDLLEELGERTSRSRTYADVLFDAFEHVDDADLMAAFRPLPASTSPAGVPRRPITRTAEPGIQRQFRVTQEQLEWVSERATTFAAPSRSALCVQVLRLYFASTKDGQRP